MSTPPGGRPVSLQLWVTAAGWTCRRACRSATPGPARSPRQYSGAGARVKNLLSHPPTARGAPTRPAKCVHPGDRSRAETGGDEHPTREPAGIPSALGDRRRMDLPPSLPQRDSRPGPARPASIRVPGARVKNLAEEIPADPYPECTRLRRAGRCAARGGRLGQLRVAASAPGAATSRVCRNSSMRAGSRGWAAAGSPRLTGRTPCVPRREARLRTSMPGSARTPSLLALRPSHPTPARTPSLAPHARPHSVPSPCPARRPTRAAYPRTRWPPPCPSPHPAPTHTLRSRPRSTPARAGVRRRRRGVVRGGGCCGGWSGRAAPSGPRRR
jgi:hypothetical protein